MSLASRPLEERLVFRKDLRVGGPLAEGGEGRVFEMPLQPHLVFKEYRNPAARPHLEDLVCWPQHGESELTGRVRAAASWPEAVVVSPSSRAAVGVLMARAPRRFALRHRDGTTRLATLSYLTADPRHREVAYGIDLPAAFSPERLGIVYALARLLEAFERLEPPVGHGDLSAKNVLWSLQRGPEIFLIDCDNCERYADDGSALSHEDRRRAMTPNWDDPAIPPGGNPNLTSDRYSLALIFLRVVGAANFPVQARQRQGGSISIDFPVPPGYAREVLLRPAAPLWDLCSWGLSTARPQDRPTAAEWVSSLEAVLDGLSAGSVMRAVWAAQGGGPGGPPRLPTSAGPSGDVAIRPVVATPREAPPPRRLTPPAASAGNRAGGFTVLPAQRPTPGSGPANPSSPVTSGRTDARVPVVASRPVVRAAVSWWVGAHGSLLRSIRRRAPFGERLAHLALCCVVDLALGAAILFLVAMAVAPLLGI